MNTIRSWVLVAAASLIASVGAGDDAKTQEFAKAYAPMYWFAIDEPIYPTLPHPFAFDGIPMIVKPTSGDQNGNSDEVACTFLRGQGPADFDNPGELTLDERCARLALKRRFRPLSQAEQPNQPTLGPAPRMRILYQGPDFFSGSIDISRFARICDASADGRNAEWEAMEDWLSDKHFLRVRDMEPMWPGAKRPENGGRNAPDLPKDEKASASKVGDGDPPVICSGKARYLDRRFRADGKKPRRVTLKIRPAWKDTCKGQFVGGEPKDLACRGGRRLFVSSGLEALFSEDSASWSHLPFDHGPWDVLLRPRYLMQYWSYYMYDLGLNGHRHDGEHVFVFIEGQHTRPLEMTDPVVAVVGGGHDEETANNILVSGSIQTNASVVEGVVFPLQLPKHIAVLPELGKHATAPDRNLNGIFDIGFDANVFPTNAWGSRDSQQALLGKAEYSTVKPWYSFPKSADAVFVEEGAWERPSFKRLHGEYEVGYPTEAFRTFESRIAPENVRRDAKLPGPCDFRNRRTYRLMPISVLYELQLRIKAENWQETLKYLSGHKPDFWEDKCGGDLPLDFSPEIQGQLRLWGATESEKRDVWVHDKFRDPDSVFRTHLFPRVWLGFNVLSPAVSTRQFSWLSLAFSDLGKKRYLHDSALELSFYRRPQGKAGNGGKVFGFLVENYRGRFSGVYWGGFTDAEGESTRRWNLRAGFAVQAASLARISPKLKRFRLNVKAGVQGLVTGGMSRSGGGSAERDRRIGFDMSANIFLGLWPSKHPLKFFPDVGEDRKSQR